MISGLTLVEIYSWFRKSLFAQVGIAIVSVFGIYTLIDARGQSKGIKKVVAASKEAGKKRNAKSRKIRSSINPSTAMQRLRREYADGR